MDKPSAGKTRKRIWNSCARCGTVAVGLQHYSRFYHPCRDPLTKKVTWRPASGAGEVIYE